MIGSVSSTQPAFQRPPPHAQEAVPSQSAEKFSVAQLTDEQLDVIRRERTSHLSEADLVALGRKADEAILKGAQTQLEGMRLQMRHTKEYVEDLPVSIQKLSEQLDIAVPEERLALSEKIQTRNDLLISLSKDYANLLEGWDAFSAKQTDIIEKMTARLGKVES